jgi:hypothetical protein
MPGVTSSRAWLLRAATLTGAGTFAVHQARYALGYRDEASGVLAAQGHAYLIAAGPLVAGALMLVLAQLIRRVARGSGAPAPRLRRLWPATTIALVVIYVVQESVEGALAAHHPAGAAGVLGHGGWLAVPLAAVVGLAIALAMRGASAATELVAGRRPWRPPPPAAPRSVAAARCPAAPSSVSPLAHAPRAPPLLAF